MRIRELRLKHKMTFKQLREIIGVTDGAIVNWEKGVPPSREHLLSLAELFKVTPEYLLEPSEEEQTLLAIYYSMTQKQRKLFVSLAKELRS